jgi:hypothetical protein
MAECSDIRRSIELDVPPEVANGAWTRFAFVLQYARWPGADASQSELDESFVRLEPLDRERTRVTVDLNYCSKYEGIDDEGEIAEVQKNLDWALARYKAFVEEQAAA